ncbi:hypothetical protein [Granulicella mallensis]|nr:hypothetical protein [Granulicella mallensis]
MSTKSSKASTQTTLTTGTSSVVGGGTLNYAISSTPGSRLCGALPHQKTVNYTVVLYNNFSYTDTNGTTSQMNGGIQYVSVSGITADCSSPLPTSATQPLMLRVPNGLPISFTGSISGSNGSATLGAIVDTSKVLSILYATPGNLSSDSFTNTKTNGTVTTIGSSFTSGQSDAFSLGFLGSGTNVTVGASITTGQSNAFTETIANATSVSNASNTGTNGLNTINHSQDLFLIWLNPEVSLIGNTYSLQTQYQNGLAELPSVVEVTAGAMQSNNNATTVPLTILQRQFDPATGQNDLPGLASICADQSQYVNNCSQQGQCGCMPSDFAKILANDPLLNGNPTLNATTATNPLSIDTSGVAACSNPTPANSCRYVPVKESGSSVQMTTLLAGPECSGCDRPINSYSQTDNSSTTQTYSESHSETASYSAKGSLPFGLGSFTSTDTWTWTDTESTGAIDGTMNQIQYSLSSSTVDCSQEVLIYEDTTFHTYVTQQAPGNTSCP